MFLNLNTLHHLFFIPRPRSKHLKVLNLRHLPSQGPDGGDDLFPTLWGGALYAVDVACQQAFVDADVSGHLRNVELRKAFENGRYLIGGIRLCRFVKAADMDILVKLLPADVVSVEADLIERPLLRSGFQQKGKCLKRPAEPLSGISLDIDPLGFKPNFYYLIHITRQSIHSRH